MPATNQSMSSESLRADQGIDQWMGLVLRSGVILAACIVILGAVVYLVQHPYPIDYRVFRSEPKNLRTIPGIFSEAKAFHGPGLIQLGLLVLIATPIARVAFSVFAFLYEKDWMYVAFTLIVLGMLVFSLFGH